ncbi:7-deoxyloganetin glucosyltransferase [Ranunculus cassubicifolius]
METSSLPHKPHAVCIPLPFQSHINAMLKLAKILHSNGFHITFANTEYNHNKILSSRGTNSLLSLPDFSFETISDGLPPQSDPHASPDVLQLLESITTKGSILAKDFINAKVTSSPPVSCIISDMALISTLGAAEGLGIPQILLWPMCASTLILQCYGPEILEKISRNGNLEADIDFIHGIHDFRLQDVPSFFWDGNVELQNMFYMDLPKLSRVSAIILNTFDTLEIEVLDAMKSLLPPIYPIGPLILLEKQISNQDLRSFGSNLLKENQDCFQFLDSKPVKSVIYVNFGSSTGLTRQQLLEFAWGLANSKHNFLWVVRPDLVVGGEDADFPVEFMTEIDGRGMIITGWCPQEKVLCHSSVGGFLTHSGWNSMLDAICGGVPVVNWPYFGDQYTNCRNSCVHWGIGLQIDRDVKRCDVERIMKQLMEGEKGEEMKRKCMEWKREAEESTQLGGSSCFHITFANTEYNHNKILSSRGTDSFPSLPDFRFETISDGLPPPSDPHAAPDIMQLLESITTKCSILAKDFINTKVTSSPPVSCIISDMALLSTVEAAEELGIPQILLWPMCATTLILQCHGPEILEKISRNGDLEADVDFINGIHDFRLRDVPSFFWDGYVELQKMFYMDLPKISRVSAIILNTFETLEFEVLEAIKSLLPPIYPIGPLHLLEKQIPNQELRSFGSNLLKENQDCFQFLDSKPVNSVIYVSFGSGTKLTRQQLLEFAWGLANSKHNFLWVVRPDLILGGEDADFPVEFMTEIDGRGMIITGWCPQEKVLCHSSVGGFLTHSGWNSMLDAICGGVPVVNWPFFGDQYTNCRNSCVHWGIGLQIDRDVKRRDVERIVKQLMESEKGEEMKRKCMEWKMEAEESTKPGGSSCENLQKFVEQFKV